MFIRALALAKGATNVAATDTIRVRLGQTYADSRELGAFVVGGTNIMTGLWNYYNSITLPLNGEAFTYLAASSTASGGVMLWKSDHGSVYDRLWIGRNTAMAATGVIVQTDLSHIMFGDGVFRTATELNAIITRSFDSGSRGAMILSETLFS